MKVAWYEKQGPAHEVLVIGEMPDPIPAAGEVRIHIAASGINPGDIKKREDAFGYMAYPRLIPHSDGAGHVDQLGAGVPSEWMGRYLKASRWNRAPVLAVNSAAVPNGCRVLTLSLQGQISGRISSNLASTRSLSRWSILTSRRPSSL